MARVLIKKKGKALRTKEKAKKLHGSTSPAKSSGKPRAKPIVRSDDLPATQGMLIHLQKQFRQDLRASEKRTDARFNQIDAKFSQIDARFNQIDARFSQVDAKFNQLESQISTVLSEIHRLAILVEEQNARNKYVLDGYEQIFQRQDRLEIEVNQRLEVMEQVLSTKIGRT